MVYLANTRKEHFWLGVTPTIGLNPSSNEFAENTPTLSPLINLFSKNIAEVHSVAYSGSAIPENAPYARAGGRGIIQGVVPSAIAAATATVAQISPSWSEDLDVEIPIGGWSEFGALPPLPFPYGTQPDVLTSPAYPTDSTKPIAIDASGKVWHWFDRGELLYVSPYIDDWNVPQASFFGSTNNYVPWLMNWVYDMALLDNVETGSYNFCSDIPSFTTYRPGLYSLANAAGGTTAGAHGMVHLGGALSGDVLTITAVTGTNRQGYPAHHGLMSALNSGAPNNIQVPASGYYRLFLRRITMIATGSHLMFDPALNLNWLTPDAPTFLSDIKFVKQHNAATPAGTYHFPSFRMVVLRYNGPDRPVREVVPLPEMKDDPALYNMARINSASALFKCLTPLNTSGGMIQCIRAPDTMARPQDLYNPDVLLTLDTSDLTQRYQPATGVYVWVMPMDIHFRRYMTPWNVPQYYLTAQDMASVVLLPYSVKAAPYWSFNVEYTCALEAVTTAQRYGYCVMTKLIMDDYQYAARLLMQCPCSSENPSHVRNMLESINKAVGKGARWLVANRGPITAAATAMAPNYALFFRTMMNALATVAPAQLN